MATTSTSPTHPTPSYRIAMTSNTADPTTTKPIQPSRSASVTGPARGGLLAPPVQRAARLSLPPRLVEPIPQQGTADRRPSLQPPPPPPSPRIRRRAAFVFYGIVAQFFLAIACLFWAIAVTIILYSFDLYCLFGAISLTGSLALAVFVFLVVVAEIVTAGLGLAAFNGKLRVETKPHLLIVYLAVNLILIFLDTGLLFFCAAGGVLSFIYEKDCSGDIIYYEFIAVSSFFLLLCASALLHLLITAAISLLLCQTSELFTNRDSALNAPSTPTAIKQENLTAPAPPIKRFSQV